MVEEKSLDKIVSVLGINKKTAFDRRHKILASLGADDGNNFTDITESDEASRLKKAWRSKAKNQEEGAVSTARGA